MFGFCRGLLKPLAASLAVSLAVAQAPPEQTAEFWRQQNIYQVLTDRFWNGDPANDNASGSYAPTSPTGVHGGDFKGLEQKLDYIRALGATAIWISPIVLNAYGEYHGYAARDFYRVDPHWGTQAELQSLVAAAHARGLLVVCDIVTNHGGDLVDSGTAGYPAFRNPPATYVLRYRDAARTYAPPFDLNATNPTLAALFHAQGQIGDFGSVTQTEQGELLGLDDLRTETPFVQQAMGAIYRHWIEQIGFDGFRVDTVKHVDASFWRAWCPNVRTGAAAAGRPNFFFFGEVFDGSDAKCGSYTGTRAGQSEFLLDSVLDFPLYFAIGDVFARAAAPSGRLEDRYNALTAYTPTARDALVTFLDSHDVPRFLNAANAAGSAERLRLALTFLYTSRGIPNLYYGTEQSFVGGADPANREDMFDSPGETGPAAGDNFNMTAPQFLHVARLNNLRRLYPSLRSGEHVNLWADFGGPGTFAYARRLGAEELIVVLNTAPVGRALPARPTLQAAGTVMSNLLDPREELVIDASGQLPAQEVPPMSAKIFVAKSAVQPLAPVVTACWPLHDARQTPTRAPLVVRFSRPMNPTLTQDAFSLSPATAGTFAWSAAGDELTFTPSGLAPNTLYTLRIAARARDASPGNEFHAPFEARFRTGASALPTALPNATTGVARGIESNAARLIAQVNPNGLPTSVSFEFGPTVAYGSATPAQTIGSAPTAQDVTHALSGLTSGATLHFRVVATNQNGTVRGADQVFATLPPLAPVATLPAVQFTNGGATLVGSVQPQGQPVTGWFEYGPTTAYGSSTLRRAADDAEAYSAWNFGAQAAGGSGLGPAASLESTGGGLFLADATGGRQIDGTRSFGVYAGTGAQALTRALLNASGAGVVQLSVRFDGDATRAFSGVSLRSAAGANFAAADLLSFGLQPSSGADVLVVRGASEQTLPLGADVRGSVLDLRVEFDAPSGTYALSAKRRASAEFTTVRGLLKAVAPAVTHLGFGNFNSGHLQDLIFDNLEVLHSPALGGSGSGTVGFQEVLSGLLPGRTYHYRAVARNASGLSYGEDRIFFTAPLGPLEQWRYDHFGSLDPQAAPGGNAADPDGDGLGNLLEYALGTNPTRADAARRPVGGSVELRGQTFATLTVRRPSVAPAGVSLQGEVSTDLGGSWTVFALADYLLGAPVDQNDGTESVTVRSPVAGADVFLRLRAQTP